MRSHILAILIFNLFLFLATVLLAFNFKECIYLVYQAKGQLNVLVNTESHASFAKRNQLTELQKSNLALIPQIKNYSIDSLCFDPTQNFNTIFDQKNKPLLWLVIASKPFELQAHFWYYPIVGRVSYKGFFKKDLAQKESDELSKKGYDVELREVSAWSTLGWFNDPILSNMLNRSKGSFCNLIFHELFHATYYAASAVDFNENLAEFVAHKATIQFLRNDSLSLLKYLQNYEDNKIFKNYILQKMDFLSKYYIQIKNLPNRNVLKQQVLKNMADSIECLPLINKTRYNIPKHDIQTSKNAYFMSFAQYTGLQDSLEDVFNKIYKGKIEKLVQDLKLN